MKQNINNIDLPKNIKQMGNVDDSFKIYIEDYVFSYLQQYSKSSNNEERIAILIGESYTINGNYVLFINGAIKGEHTILEDGMVRFSEESFNYINEQIDTYFNGYSIIGWFYSQPGFSDYINDGYINYHKKQFNNENQVFFLSDPIENIGGFYRLYNNDFKDISGFIIYYEKNEAMIEYMSNNKLSNARIDNEKYKIKDEKITNISRNKNNKSSRYKKLATLSEYKKMSSIFGSLSAVLFLVCFIMGAGLIQSDDKISQLERRLTKLDENYRYILSQIKDDNVQSVFAQNNEKNKDNYIKESSSPSSTNITTYTTETTPISTTSKPEPITETTSITNTYVESESIAFKSDLKKYIVKEGDSLENISRKFYGNRDKVEEIMKINNIDNPNKIYSGMTLLLP